VARNKSASRRRAESNATTAAPTVTSRLALYSLELHGSEVATTLVAGAELTLRFSAAHVRRDDGADGYLGGVALALPGATWRGELAECIGRVVEGDLKLAGRAVTRLEIDAPPSGASTLHLRFANGATLDATADALRLAVAGDARFTEDFSC
jgi:hypothetical protein